MRKTPAREWDWIAAGLLFMLPQIAAARLVTTDWTPFLYWTESLAGFGTILGLALGLSRFRRGAVLTLAAAYTAVVLPLQLTGSVREGFLFDRLMHTGAILGASFGQFFQRQPVEETLFFLVFVCVAFWCIGLAAGYSLARHGRVLGSIVISGAALLTTQAYASYQSGGAWWLAIYLLMVLLLVGRVHFLQQKQKMMQGRVFVSEESGTNVLASIFMTAALAIIVAWWIPSAPGSLQRATDAWNTLVRPIRERLSNAVTSLQGPAATSASNFYDKSLALGQNASTGDSVVFTVEVLDSPNGSMRYYWRGRSYNDYQDGQWTTSSTSKLFFAPGRENLQIPDESARSEARFFVTSEFSVQNLIYGPSALVWLDRAADVATIRTAADVYDTLSWEARTVVSSGSKYEIRAQLRNPTVQSLRAAGESYPAWVTDEYLDVPETLRDELAGLAVEITTGANNPYDEATAITNYLRKTLLYSASVPAIPRGEDPVMWVLLKHKRGFCNYSASAEVLLLRSIGIPARLAVGFAQGDSVNGVFTVRRRNAHAWPEVYFPGIGWVEFEPTGNQSPLARPNADETTGGTPFNPPPRDRPDGEREGAPEDIEIGANGEPLPFALTPVGRALLTALPFVVALVLGILAFRLRALRRLPAVLSRTFEAGGGPAPSWLRAWERWNRLEPVERAFASVTWSLRLLGESQPAGATPAAQAAALSRRIPSASGHIEILRSELESGLYAREPANLGRSRQAALAVILHGLRARFDSMMAALDGRAVYSRQHDHTTK